MTSAAPQAGPWRARASRSSSLGYAPARSAPFCASTRPASPATAATGITCWSSAGSSRRASSISMAFTTRVARTTACCSGMKGSISEFELGILRARMLDAARSKARRGELRISVPIGYIWHREIGLGFDPDLRVQEAIRLIFSRFRQLGSARQAHLSLPADGVHFPAPVGRQEDDLVRMDADPLSQRNLGAEESVLCRRLRLR